MCGARGWVWVLGWEGSKMKMMDPNAVAENIIMRYGDRQCDGNLYGAARSLEGAPATLTDLN